MWDLPGSGIELIGRSPALAGSFFTTEPPGKPHINFIVCSPVCVSPVSSTSVGSTNLGSCDPAVFVEKKSTCNWICVTHGSRVWWNFTVSLQVRLTGWFLLCLAGQGQGWGCHTLGPLWWEVSSPDPSPPFSAVLSPWGWALQIPWPFLPWGLAGCWEGGNGGRMDGSKRRDFPFSSSCQHPSWLLWHRPWKGQH